jgi:hypothetical protein
MEGQEAEALVKVTVSLKHRAEAEADILAIG